MYPTVVGMKTDLSGVLTVCIIAIIVSSFMLLSITVVVICEKCQCETVNKAVLETWLVIVDQLDCKCHHHAAVVDLR